MAGYHPGIPTKSTTILSLVVWLDLYGFVGDELLGCPRKLGSMVRINGL